VKRAWRISNYADLQGRGGERGTGRWHRHARIVYCAENAANALLETLVHLEIESPDELPEHYQLLEIEIPDELAITSLPDDSLPEHWRDDERLTQSLGMAWMEQRTSALLHVPSAVMPAEFNLLLNPEHTDAPRIRIGAAYRYPYDRRLFKTVGH